MSWKERSPISLKGFNKYIEDSAAKLLFCYENIKNKDHLVKFYTGFPDHPTLLAFYEEILEQCQGYEVVGRKKCKDDYDEVKCDHTSKLPLLEHFL